VTWPTRRSTLADLVPEEPTNEQLAKFLVIYAKTVTGAENLDLKAPVLETIMNHDEKYRQAALKTHRRFQQDIDEMLGKMERGELRCEHIRPNGKHCPNSNEPGSFYCGLHKDEEA
jgi:hypothetical protein